MVVEQSLLLSAYLKRTKMRKKKRKKRRRRLQTHLKKNLLRRKLSMMRKVKRIQMRSPRPLKILSAMPVEVNCLLIVSPQ